MALVRKDVIWHGARGGRFRTFHVAPLGGVFGARREPTLAVAKSAKTPSSREKELPKALRAAYAAILVAVKAAP